MYLRCLQNGGDVEVWVYDSTKAGLQACYQGLQVFVPWYHLQIGNYESHEVSQSTL